MSTTDGGVSLAASLRERVSGMSFDEACELIVEAFPEAPEASSDEQAQLEQANAQRGKNKRKKEKKEAPAWKAGEIPTTGKAQSFKEDDVDPVFLQQLVEVYQGIVTGSEKKDAYNFLLQQHDDGVAYYMRKVEEYVGGLDTKKSGGLFGKKTSKGVAPLVVLDKYALGFGYGDREVPLNTTVEDTFTATNLSNRKVKLNISMPPSTSKYTLKVEPTAAVLKKKGSVDFRVSLTCSTTVNVRQVVEIIADEVFPIVACVNLVSERSQFGVEVNQLDLVNDYGVMVPKVLVTMKNYLFERQGHLSEGIFRLAPDEEENRLVKEQLNKGEFTGCTDINCIANLIKVWYREMPMHVLNSLPPEAFADCYDTDTCVQAYLALKDPYQALMSWILDLMCDIHQHEGTNKMSLKALSIVVSPNLFEPANDSLQSLTLSQKIATFVETILEWRKNSRQE